MDHKTRVAKAQVLQVVSLVVGLTLTFVAAAYFEEQLEQLKNEEKGESKHE
jgi:hypothetical protein